MKETIYRLLSITTTIATIILTVGCDSNGNNTNNNIINEEIRQPVVAQEKIVENKNTTHKTVNKMTAETANKAMLIIINNNRTLFKDAQVKEVFTGELADELLTRYNKCKNLKEDEYCNIQPKEPKLQNFEITGEHTCEIEHYEPEDFTFKYTFVFDDTNERIKEYSIEPIRIS